MFNVCVLMSTYNGEKYISQQIQSILNQKDCNITLIIRDDGSTDKTIDILSDFSESKNIIFYKGKNIGPAKSFLKLLIDAEKYDYYAFADQDDVWFEDKIISAINKINLNDTKKPVLYFSNLKQTDSKLNIINENLLGNEPSVDFFDIIIRCTFIFGCTMVMNKMSKDLLTSLPFPVNFNMHDCLIAYIISAFGEIIYDPVPHIYYRQHDENVCGSKKSIIKKNKERFKLLFHPNNKLNISTVSNYILSLHDISNLYLDNDKIQILNIISNMKKFEYKKIVMKKIKTYNGNYKRCFFRKMLILFNRY